MVSKKRINTKKAGFNKYSVKEMIKDRKIYIESITNQAIQEAFTLQQAMCQLFNLDQVIKFRQIQLKSENIQETFNGAKMPDYLLESELELTKVERYRLFKGYTKLREKFVKEYDISDQDVIDHVLKGTFDFVKWQQDRIMKETLELEKNAKISK